METLKRALIHLLLLSSLTGADKWRLVNNDVEHYGAKLPATWEIWGVDAAGTLSATTYSRGRAPEGGLVPPGEAAIRIFSNKSKATTIAVWIDQATRQVKQVRRRKMVLTADRRGVNSYIEI